MARFKALSPLHVVAVLALLAAVILAVILPGGKSPSVTTGRHGGTSVQQSLTKALGTRQPDAPLVRNPAPHVSVTILESGFKVADHDGSVGLASAGATGTWRRYQHGVLRRTPFGSEAILFDDKGQGGEQFLVVRQHHGQQIWRWRLDTSLQPRVTAKGAVGFFDGHHMAALWIPPARVLDASQHDVSPRGATWRTVKRGGTWWLELALNDHKLPLPYTIDPAVLRTSGAGTVATITGAGTTLSVNIPGAVAAQDLLFLHFAQATGTVPACPNGWNIANLSGGTTSGVFTTGLGEITCWKKAAGATLALPLSASATQIASAIDQLAHPRLTQAAKKR